MNSKKIPVLHEVPVYHDTHTGYEAGLGMFSSDVLLERIKMLHKIMIDFSLNNPSDA
jgi:hypothetical protein